MVHEATSRDLVETSHLRTSYEGRSSSRPPEFPETKGSIPAGTRCSGRPGVMVPKRHLSRPIAVFLVFEQPLKQ